MEHRRAAVQFFDHGVNGIAQHFAVVQLDIQISAQFQFASQIAHYRLEERVNRFDAEATVVMDDVFQCLGSGFADFCIRFGGMLPDFVEITVRIRVFMGNAVKLAQNALFHFGGCFVGKGYSQNAPIGKRIFDKLADVFHCQSKRFARTGRSAIY